MKILAGPNSLRERESLRPNSRSCFARPLWYRIKWKKENGTTVLKTVLSEPLHSLSLNGSNDTDKTGTSEFPHMLWISKVPVTDISFGPRERDLDRISQLIITIIIIIIIIIITTTTTIIITFRICIAHFLYSTLIILFIIKIIL